MRRPFVVALLATLASAGTLPAAVAATPGCVTRAEYGRVTPGMTQARVHRIFDTEGVLTNLGAPDDLRYYDTCTGRGVVQVVFDPSDRVRSKNARFF